MINSSKLGFGGLFLLTTFLVVGYAYEDQANASVEQSERVKVSEALAINLATNMLSNKTEPLSITIESEKEKIGIKAENEVKEVYETRKERLSDNLKNILKEEKDPERLKALNYTLDSLSCMDESIKQYPKLIDVIQGEDKNAREIYQEMEGNCVEDVLFYLKRNHPKMFSTVNKAFIDSGFVTPEIKD